MKRFSGIKNNQTGLRWLGGPKKAFSKAMQRRYAQPGQDYRTVTPQQMAQQEALRQRQAAQAIGGKGGGIRQLPVRPGRPYGPNRTHPDNLIGRMQQAMMDLQRMKPPVGPGRPMMKKGGAVKKTAAKKGKK